MKIRYKILLSILIIILLVGAFWLHRIIKPYIPKDYMKYAWDCGMSKGIENC